MGLDFKVLRNTFFDAAAVSKAMDRKTRQALSKFGAFVRTRARTSIKRRKKPSDPGKPPHTQRGTLKLIFFAYDPSTKSTVVGPIIAQAKDAGVVPRLHEKGGQKTNTKQVPGAVPRQISDKQKASFRRKIRDGSIVAKQREFVAFVARYEKRAYMEPAMMAELPKFAGLFRG